MLQNSNSQVQSSGESKQGGFVKFLLRGNVVDLAVGIVIGASFNDIVNGFVKDFITPLIAHALTLLQLQGINPNTFANASWSGFMVGDFITNVISFLITASVLYFFIVGPINAVQDHFFRRKDAEAPRTRDCPFCLNVISVQATRCGHCTSPLPPPGNMPPSPAYMPQAQAPFAENVQHGYAGAPPRGYAGTPPKAYEDMPRGYEQGQRGYRR